MKELYELNKKLDEEFINRYKDTTELQEKNCLSLLTEIGELANETKVFKYWSIKEMDLEDTLEEFADILIMTLTFSNYLNVDIEEIDVITDDSPTKVFLELYEVASKFNKNYNETTIKEIYYLIFKLSTSLKLDKNDIILAAKKKIDKIYRRLESDY